jgi:hypothetical protein
MVIRGQLRGHDDTPFGRPTPGRRISRRRVGRPQGVFGVFNYYQLVKLFFNIVPHIIEFIHLIVEFTLSIDDSSSWPPKIETKILNPPYGWSTPGWLSYWLGAVLFRVSFYCFVDIIKINN